MSLVSLDEVIFCAATVVPRASKAAITVVHDRNKDIVLLMCVRDYAGCRGGLVHDPVSCTSDVLSLLSC